MFDQGRAIRDFAEALCIGYIENTRAQGHALFLKPSATMRYMDKGQYRHLFCTEKWNEGSITVKEWDEQPFS